MKSKLTYFKPHEFTRDGVEWFDYMCPSLLVRLDVLRNMWGDPIRISPHPKAVGREDQSNSQHNFAKWGEVRAVDVFFDVPEKKEHWNEKERAANFSNICRSVNFSGIGIYPTVQNNGKRQTMFHLDCGNRKATWSRIGDKYLDFESGLKWLEENGT